MLNNKHSIYCVEAWGNAFEVHITPLITLQKKIIRIITFSPFRAHTTPLFKQINVLPFQKIVFNKIGLQMFKYNIGDIPNALKTLFIKNSSIHNYNTRSRDKLRPALSKHRFRDKDFSFISVHIWNYICDNINIAINFCSFKRKLKYFILSEKFAFNMKLNN